MVTAPLTMNRLLMEQNAARGRYEKKGTCPKDSFINVIITQRDTTQARFWDSFLIQVNNLNIFSAAETWKPLNLLLKLIYNSSS